MGDRQRYTKRPGLCVGCGGGTHQQVQAVSEVWLYVCSVCDSPDSALAGRLRELRR